VAMATGMAPSTIGRGLRELAQDEPSSGFGGPGRAQADDLQRTDATPRISSVGRTNDTRGSGIAVRWTARRAPAGAGAAGAATK